MSYINPKLSFILSKLSKHDNLDIPLPSKFNSTHFSPSPPSNYLFNLWKSSKISHKPSLKLPTFTEKFSNKRDLLYELLTSAIFNSDFPIIPLERKKFFKEWKAWVAQKTIENGHFKRYYYGKFVNYNSFCTSCMSNFHIDEEYLPIFADFININLLIIKHNLDNHSELIYKNLYDHTRLSIVLEINSKSSSIKYSNNTIKELWNNSDIISLRSQFDFPKYSLKELEKFKYDHIVQISLSLGIPIYKQGLTKVTGLTKGEIINKIIEAQNS